MKLKKDEKLQSNFWMNEFLSDNDKQAPTPEMLINLTKLSYSAQALRTKLGNMRITSGARSVEFNKAVGGDSNSNHLTGKAMDFELIDENGKENYGTWTVEKLLPIFNSAGISNVGFYFKQGKFQWIHADIGKTWGNVKDWKRFSNTLSYRRIEVK